MKRGGPLRCVLFGEDRLHHRLADKWTRRRLREALTWTRDLPDDALLCWERPDRPWHTYTEIKRRERPKRRIRLHRRKPPKNSSEGPMFLRTLLWARLELPDVEAVYVARDVDHRPERRRGYEWVRSVESWPFLLIGLLAEPEAEAWVIAGFEPEDASERGRLERLRSELGFDCRSRPERLTSTSDGPKDAKHVLHRLVEGDEDRIERCLEAGFECLIERGKKSGIAEFMRDLDEMLQEKF